MQVKPAEADRFVAAPPASLRVALFYGPDGGLVRERALRLVTAVVETPDDPFRVVEVTPKQLSDNPSLVADETAALSFTGGRRALRLRSVDATVTAAIKNWLAGDMVGDGLVVIEASELKRDHALVKALGNHKAGAAIACYRDEGTALGRVIADSLRDAGVEASREALDYLTRQLGGDRQITRRELEKLALFARPADDGGRTDGSQRPRIELADAEACVGDSASLALDDLAQAVAEGDLVELERTLERVFQEGTAPIGIIRALVNHLRRLHLVIGAMAGGESADSAMGRLRPPVFWKVKGRFQAQTRLWSPSALARALDRLLETEALCKRSGTPDRAVTAQTLFAIAAQARAQKRNLGRAGGYTQREGSPAGYRR